MPPVLSIVGKKKSGKTTLIERVLAVLSGKGFRVATVKHDVHRFLIDHEGKDTFRHQRAGAAAVLISSPEKMAFIKKTRRQVPLDELIATYLSEYDLVITEGFSSADKPKIEVVRAERGSICGEADLLATVGPVPPGMGVPHFDWNDISGITQFIIDSCLRP